MAERLMLICDICTNPAVETITFKTSSGSRLKDYCSTHLQELLKGSRPPKRGRRPNQVASRARVGVSPFAGDLVGPCCGHSLL